MEYNHYLGMQLLIVTKFRCIIIVEQKLHDLSIGSVTAMDASPDRTQFMVRLEEDQGLNQNVRVYHVANSNFYSSAS